MGMDITGRSGRILVSANTYVSVHLHSICAFVPVIPANMHGCSWLVSTELQEDMAKRTEATTSIIEQPKSRIKRLCVGRVKTGTQTYLEQLGPAVWANGRKRSVLRDGHLLWQPVHRTAAAEHHLQAHQVPLSLVWYIVSAVTPGLVHRSAVARAGIAASCTAHTQEGASDRPRPKTRLTFLSPVSRMARSSVMVPWKLFW